MELDGSGNRLRAYTYYPGIDQPHSVREFTGNNAGRYYFAMELPGHVTGLLNASGARVNQYRYSAYGKLEHANETVPIPGVSPRVARDSPTPARDPLSAHCPTCGAGVPLTEHLRATRSAPVRCGNCSTLLAVHPRRLAYAIAVVLETLLIFISAVAMFAWGWWTLFVGFSLALVYHALLRLVTPLNVVYATEVCRTRRIHFASVALLFVVLMLLTLFST